MSDVDGAWYRQALYEQAWENYRNEDENYRATVWQSLVFSSALIYAASQSKPATTFIGILGFVVSLSTLLFLGRITRYSWRWLIAKGSALSAQHELSEVAHLKEAESAMPVPLALVSRVPGYVSMLALPVASAIFFL